MMTDKVQRFIKFFEDRVENPRALHDELSAHAFRLRHIDADISKVFIHYSPESYTGKSLLSSVLSWMYPYSSAIIQSRLGFEFPADAVNVVIEEGPSKPYKSVPSEIHRLHSILNRPLFFQSNLFPQSERSEPRCILAVNTNDSDLCGLVHADGVLQSRLVILKFKA